MTVEAHRIMMRQIERSLNDAGFWSAADLKKKSRISNKRLHGFDESKFNAASLFYLPCQAKDPGHSFFFEFNGADRQALDVDQWVKHALGNPRTFLSRYEVPREESVVAASPGNRVPLVPRDEAVSRAITAWRSVGAGEGNKGFFVLGVRLHEAGMNFPDIESTLKREAAHGLSPKDRLKQIKSIIQYLQARDWPTDPACSRGNLAA